MGSGREGGSCTEYKRPPPSSSSSSSSSSSNRTSSTCNKADSPTIQPLRPPRLWQINGQLYDLRAFAASHPGGAWQIELSAGWDVTNLVQSYHDLTPAFFKRIKPYAVGTTEGRTAHSVTLKENVASSESRAASLRKEFHTYPTAPPQDECVAFDPLVVDCRQCLRDAVSSSSSSVGGADLRYLKANWVACAFYAIFGFAYAYSGYLWYSCPSLSSAASFGLFAWIFTGLAQHEGSHSALSRSPTINFFARMTLIPWSNPRTWFIKHTVSHHQFTNTCMDQDVQKSWFLRHHEDIPWTPYHISQVLTIHLGGIFELFFYSTKDTIRDLRERPPRWGESALYAVLAVGQFTAHVSMHQNLFLTLLPYFVYGVCFSTITQWSHIQEECFEASLAATPPDFVRHQVASCVDYSHGNWIVSTISIFLNYQTYHHLFPGVSHFQLAKPSVKRRIDRFLTERGLLCSSNVVTGKESYAAVGKRSAWSACRSYLKYLSELSQKAPQLRNNSIVAKGGKSD